MAGSPASRDGLRRGPIAGDRRARRSGGEASGHITALSLEGEPGIGKSRLLLTAADIATARGPPRSPSRATRRSAARSWSRADLLRGRAARGQRGPHDPALDRAGEILAGQDDPAFAGLPATDRALRVIDQATLALRLAALGRPIALLLDDLQWADQDSLRLLRYLVRTQPGLPVFIAMALRPEEPRRRRSSHAARRHGPDGAGPANRVARFHLAETAEMLRQTLGVR